jgi:REP element-mobilizing transposase RayT
MICGSRASSVGYNEFTRDDGRMDRKRTLRCDSKYVHFLMFSSKNSPIFYKWEWKKYFWSRSFCLITTGGVPIEVIKKYIENQGK